jgi:hypothetical protein
MEQQNQESSLFDLRVDENMKEEFRGLSKWTMIVVISSVISLVLTLLQTLGAKKETIEFSTNGLRRQQTTNVGSTIISMIIAILMAYLLYQFSVYVKKGVDNLSQNDLNKGLGSLKTYFMVFGIIMIIVAVIFLVVVVVAGSTAVGS